MDGSDSSIGCCDARTIGFRKLWRCSIALQIGVCADRGPGQGLALGHVMAAIGKGAGLSDAPGAGGNQSGACQFVRSGKSALME